MQSYPIKSPRKLIEVSLPLDIVNVAAAREKSIRHGHPSTLHQWWARRPLAAVRAVLFAQLVNDPGTNIGSGFRYGMDKKKAVIERKRLFKIIEDLVQWNNTKNESVINAARAEIRRSWLELCELNRDHPEAATLFNPDEPPAFHDPFAGGGAIPLEAQRLGLKAYASDLNPVAVLINKAMIEIPPRFANMAPVSLIHSRERAKKKELDLDRQWSGPTGLAEDVRYYGAWMRDEAQKRIGHLYPPAEVTAEMARDRPALKVLVGQKLPVIAWIWVRTVKSPNPAFSHVDVPLASTFILSDDSEATDFVQPVIRGDNYRFTVKTGTPPSGARAGTSAGKRKAFRCLLSDVPIDYEHIRTEAKAGRMKQRLLAVVAKSQNGRVYLPATTEVEDKASEAAPSWKPSGEMPKKHRNFQPPVYGMNTFGDLFTRRQLLALNTFADLVGEARDKIREDGVIANLPGDKTGLASGGAGATAYAEAISVYLAFCVDYAANYWSEIATPAEGFIRGTFARQALPMTWDFAEAPPFGSTSGNWMGGIEWIAKAIEMFPDNVWPGQSIQADAASQTISVEKIVSTDPPYYDNIAYAELSDFFYPWLRKSLRPVFPLEFASMAVPKLEELVAAPHRHGSKQKAEDFFLSGMTEAMKRLANQAHPAVPISIYYAFKQSETDDVTGTSSTGWDTFLQAVQRAGFQITGTWPMRTERGARSVGIGANALASSIILVCRKRPKDAPSISRREFIRELNGILPEALDEMTKGSGEERSGVAPVDLSQAIIGPGMAVFSQYAAVLEADGSSMSVRTALQLINRFLAEDDFDADTQFCLHWFEQHGWTASVFGEADTLARAKGTSVDGAKEAGVIESGGGRVRLLKWSEYPSDWDPRTDTRTPVWEALHQLIRAYRQGGDSASGALLAALDGKVEAVRQLAYRLYTLCERLGQVDDARAYNELITGWSGIESAAGAVTGDRDLFGDSV